MFNFKKTEKNQIKRLHRKIHKQKAIVSKKKIVKGDL